MPLGPTLEDLANQRRADQQQRRQAIAALASLAPPRPAGPLAQGISSGLDASYGDARLDGSTGTARKQLSTPTPIPDDSAAAAAGVRTPPGAQFGTSPAPAATPDVPTGSTYTPSGNLYGGSLASRPDNTLQRVGDPTSLVPGAANGGMIRGRGTGTSDSNMIRVSTGEAVLPADVVRALGGKAAIDAMIAKHHKPVAGAPPRGFVNGGVVDRVDDDPTVWNKFVDAVNTPQRRPLAPPLASLGDPSTELADRPQLVGRSGTGNAAVSVNPMTGAAFTYPGAGRATTRGTPLAMSALLPPQGEGGRTAAEIIDAGGLRSPVNALAAPAPLASAVSRYNATAGQAQLRASDNALAARADDVDNAARAAFAAANPVNYADPNDPRAAGGWLGRDYIRGGAAPGAPAAGRTTPGTQFESNYGYGDTVRATADQNGRFTQFSGVGTNKPGIADLSAGLQRAAANREELARIEDARTGLAPPVQATADMGQRGDARLDGGRTPFAGRQRGAPLAPVPGSLAYTADPRAEIDAATANANIAATRAGTRATSQGIVNSAGEVPYARQALAARATESGAQADSLRATAGRTNALAPGEVQAQGIANKGAQLSLAQQVRMDSLATKAANSTDVRDHEAYASFVRSAKGAGGNVTPEDKLKGYTGYIEAWLKSAAAMDGKSTPMSYAEFDGMVSGKQIPIAQNPRALSIQADLAAGRIKQDEAERQLRTMGYR